MAHKLNRKTFFSYVRRAPFGGTISQQQVDGLNKMLDYWEDRHIDVDPRWLSYILASVFHETAGTITPIEEYGGENYLKKKKYYPWYGRGLIQITWKENYLKYGITNPKEALEWGSALYICFHGMIEGKFTGKKLSQFFKGEHEDPVGARGIVNGKDKSVLIAGYYKNFKDAIDHALLDEQPKDVKEIPKEPPITLDPQVIITTGGGIISSLIAAVTSPWGVAALVVIVSTLVLCGCYYIRYKEKYTKGV